MKVYVVVESNDHHTGSWGDSSWQSHFVLGVFEKYDDAVRFIEANAISFDMGHPVENAHFEWEDGRYVYDFVENTYGDGTFTEYSIEEFEVGVGINLTTRFGEDLFARPTVIAEI